MGKSNVPLLNETTLASQAEALGQKYPVLRDQLPELSDLQKSAGLDASKIGGYATRVLARDYEVHVLAEAAQP